MLALTESVVEDAALSWLEALGYQVLQGPDIAAGETAAERSDPELLQRGVRSASVRDSAAARPWRSMVREHREVRRDGQVTERAGLN